MADISHDERRQRGLDVLGTLRGTGSPHVEAAALEYENGALGSFVLDFALGDVWSRPGLSRRDRSLIVVTVLTAINQERQLRSHVAGALNHGLTPEEIREIVTHLCGYCGFPRALNGMAVVNEVFAERGIDVEPIPAEPKSSDARRRDGTQVARGLMQNGISDDPERAYATMTEQLGPVGAAGLEFIFGDIWSRPQLSRRDRSLLVVSALTALGRVDELVFHIPAAIHHGVTRAELEELMLMLAAYAGFPFAVEGIRCLQRMVDKAPSLP